MNDVVITAALRSAVGKFNGSLGKVSAAELGAQIIKALLARSGVQPDQISEVILGQVLTAGVGQNPARQAVIQRRLAGQCAGDDHQQGLRLAASRPHAGGASDKVRRRRDRHRRRSGKHEPAPHVLPGSRDGFRMGDCEARRLA